MLELMIPGKELWDDDKQEFIYTKSHNIQFEHSLVSLSKWESKWCKPFLSKDEKSREETLDYIRCMTITQNVKSEVYDYLSSDLLDRITDYIDAPMTATWFSERSKGKSSKPEVITAEIIYYWMIVHNIPVDFQKWHLNRLLTLIRVCSIKNNPPSKVDKKELLNDRKALNESRRQEFNTKG